MLAVALVCAAPAGAAFPGENGKIAFIRQGANAGLWTMNPDGSGVSQFPNGGAGPAWSPNGTKIAFSSGAGIHVANADGTGNNVVVPGLGIGHPAWSPDGLKLAYVRDLGGPGADEEIYASNADGTGEVQLTFNGFMDHDPSWSPDGTQIAFYSVRGDKGYIFVMNADGTDEVQLTPSTSLNNSPDWSPDGQRIGFLSTRSDGNGDIWTMKPDGSDPQKLAGDEGPDHQMAWSPDGTQVVYWHLLGGIGSTFRVVNADGTGDHEIFRNDASNSSAPSWQPIVGGYPRPKGASPLHVSLVPAMQQCSSYNRNHGPPLAFPSCNPPAPWSSHLTIGVGDGSSAFARGIGSVRLSVLTGVPGGPDDADVRVKAHVTNVMNTSDLSEYTGALQAEVQLQITDKNNTPHPGGPGPATMIEIPFPFHMPCTPTADTMVKSTCEVTTTFDSVVPGAVKEGVRSIWSMRQVTVYDGGADGDPNTAPNRPFLIQGIFVP